MGEFYIQAGSGPEGEPINMRIGPDGEITHYPSEVGEDRTVRNVIGGPYPEAPSQDERDDDTADEDPAESAQGAVTYEHTSPDGSVRNVARVPEGTPVEQLGDVHGDLDLSGGQNKVIQAGDIEGGITF